MLLEIIDGQLKLIQLRMLHNRFIILERIADAKIVTLVSPTGNVKNCNTFKQLYHKVF